MLFVGWIGCCYFVCALFVVLIVVGACCVLFEFCVFIVFIAVWLWVYIVVWWCGVVAVCWFMGLLCQWFAVLLICGVC